MSITHPELVKALAKPGSAIAQSMTAKTADLLHHAVGVAGECGELLDALIDYPCNMDRENLVEELGDLEFYMEGMRQNLGITREEVLPLDFERMQSGVFTTAASLTISGLNLLDHIKKIVIYEKEPDLSRIKHEMAYFESFMEFLRNDLEITYEETIEANIAKLQVRYSAGSFSNKQAQDRADKAMIENIQTFKYGETRVAFGTEKVDPRFAR